MGDVSNIQEQDIKDLSDELVHELQVAGLLLRDHEHIFAYDTIYRYLKGKYGGARKEE